MSIRSKLLSAVSPVLLLGGVGSFVTAWTPTIANTSLGQPIVRNIGKNVPQGIMKDSLLAYLTTPKDTVEITKKMNQGLALSGAGSFGILGALLTKNLRKLKKVAE